MSMQLDYHRVTIFKWNFSCKSRILVRFPLHTNNTNNRRQSVSLFHENEVRIVLFHKDMPSELHLNRVVYSTHRFILMLRDSEIVTNFSFFPTHTQLFSPFIHVTWHRRAFCIKFQISLAVDECRPTNDII